MSTFAGNWDPSSFQNFFGSQDPYEELLKQYPASKGSSVDPSKLSKEAQEIYAAIHGAKTQDPSSAILTARLQDIGARRASELSKQNIDYAVAQQNKYEAQRDKRRFQYGILAKLSDLPGQMFAQDAAYKLLGSQMGTQSLANILGSPSPSFSASAIQPQVTRFYG